MNACQTRFIKPLDVLFLRGNKLFGDPGSYGESLVPPWPSVAAGALRSRMLADDGIDLAAFARGKVKHETLGTPAQPGSFAITAFHLARGLADGRVEALIAPPADLVLSEDATGMPSVNARRPVPFPSGLMASTPFAALPALAERTRSKPASSYWLTESGWCAYLSGKLPAPTEFVKSSALWQIDARVGVGLDADTGHASDGRLFSLQAVTLAKRWASCANDVGFLVSVSGAALPKDGLLRLGGDGRAAAIHAIDYRPPVADYAALITARRCRMILATPGVFKGGWLPNGFTQAADGTYRFALAGVNARLVCAAVPRFETISGWDLARWQPKPAQRAASTGSVYWLDELDASPESLRKLAEQGLWNDPCEDAQRRAEGFNRVVFAAWHEEQSV